MGLLSAIYSAALSARRLVYDFNLKKSKKLSSKVISIGNLTLGGTGKTPLVIAIAHEAKKRGFKSCILTRGYRGKEKGPCFISKGQGPLLNTHRAGDEPILMAERLQGIPVVMGKDRYKSGIFAMENLQSEFLFILDDGFQHWALYRDLDILLLDATNPFGNGKLFPEGILREPLKAMSRAQVVVLTKIDMVCSEVVKSIVHVIKQHNPSVTLYKSFYKTSSLVNISGEMKSVESIKQKPLYAFAGIANPSYFKSILKSREADIVKFKIFKDHHNYNQRDIDKIKKDAGSMEIITTEKDLVKLRRLELHGNIFALRIDFSIDEAFYDILFKRISDRE